MTMSWKLVPSEPQDEQQLAGAQAIRFDTTPINKIFTANRVYRDMVAAAPDAPVDLAAAQEEAARLRAALEDVCTYVEECLSSAVGSSAVDTKMIDRALNGVRQAKP